MALMAAQFCKLYLHVVDLQIRFMLILQFACIHRARCQNDARATRAALSTSTPVCLSNASAANSD